MKKILAVLLGAAVLLGLATVTYASIPASNGVINGCYNNDLGTLRVIDSEETCLLNETALDWNQAGEPGLSGYEVVSETYTIPANSGGFYEASCPAGKKVLGGGDEDHREARSHPNASGTAWVIMTSSGGSSHTFTVWATCAFVAN